MLDLGARAVGQEFRGATQTGAFRYLASQQQGHPVGYIDCGTFNRWAVYDGHHREDAIRHPELATVRRFAAGVEPANRACIRCLEAAGFQCYAALPDFEGMLYYLLDRK